MTFWREKNCKLCVGQSFEENENDEELDDLYEDDDVDDDDEDDDDESQYGTGNYTTCAAAAVKSHGGVKIPRRPLKQKRGG